MKLDLRTPGVYLQELNAFPNTVTSVATDVAAFAGYTEKAVYNDKPLTNIPTRIASLPEFETLFGKGPGDVLQFSIAVATAGEETSSLQPVITPDQKRFMLGLQSAAYRLYDNMRLFFLNGGTNCYIVSVGDYTTPISIKDLSAGIDMLLNEQDPTILVIPDAVSLPAAGHATIVQHALAHCVNMQNRVAILDVYNGAVTHAAEVDKVINDFRNNTGNNGLSYGAAYFPWLVTNIVKEDEISFINFPAELFSFLEDTAPVKKAADAAAVISSSTDPSVKNIDSIKNANADLLTASNCYRQITGAALSIINVCPPSAAMAGIYCVTDNTRGVANAPANISVAGVTAPTINLTDTQLEGLNVDAVTGKSINAIRSFPSQGVLVWGARTLDGNSNDWRYINVRRTMIMIEQSVKLAARIFVFEPNTANTWVVVKSMISNFLFNLWRDGTLVGAKPEDAYSVSVGLGSTMTADDILNGFMNISVMVAVTHPAEFMVITFQQQMPAS